MIHGQDHEDRIKSALKNKNAHIPVMKGADKDHKTGFNEAIGPPLRPIVGADEAPNGQISSVMTEILQALSLELDKVENVMCLSTEEMLYAINTVNTMDETDEEHVIFSQDFKEMYTRLHIPTVCQVAAEEFYNSNLQLEVDAVELGLYLAIVYDRDYLVDMGLGDVTHTRRYNRGPKPSITTPEILTRSHDTVS